MNDPIRYDSTALSAEQVRVPPPPATPTAWQSIPTFIRFTVWLYAILTVLGLVIWPILMIAIVTL